MVVVEAEALLAGGWGLAVIVFESASASRDPGRNCSERRPRRKGRCHAGDDQSLTCPFDEAAGRLRGLEVNSAQHDTPVRSPHCRLLRRLPPGTFHASTLLSIDQSDDLALANGGDLFVLKPLAKVVEQFCLDCSRSLAERL